MRPRLRRALGFTRRHPKVPLANPTPYAGDEKARNQRNDAAVSLIEDDTFAYVVVRLRKAPLSASGRIEVVGHVLPGFWPAFKETFERLIHAGDEFYPDPE